MSEHPTEAQGAFDSGYPQPVYDDPKARGEQARAAVDDDEISLIDLLIVLAKHKLLLIGLPLVAGIFAAVNVLLQPNVYTATTKLLPPQHSDASGAALLMSQLGALAGVSGQLGAKNTNELYIAMLKSRTVADNLIRRFDLMKEYKAKHATEARAHLGGPASITLGKDGLITIEYTHTDPQRAAELANAYVDELMKLTQVLAVTEASQRRLFFERQLAQAKNNLAQAEIAARKGLAQRGIVKVDEQGRTMVETTARLRAQITVKEVQIGAMRTFATDENPELRMAQRELEATKRELAKIEGDGSAGPSDRLGNPSQGMESVHLLRDMKYHEVVFELLAKQYEIAKIEEAKESSVIQVLDRAVPPDLKSGPKRLVTVLFTALVAGIVAIVLAFLLEAFARARVSTRQADRFRALRHYLSWRRA
jgi:tyrosine-protein kinase Etk/Wzc